MYFHLRLPDHILSLGSTADSVICVSLPLFCCQTCYFLLSDHVVGHVCLSLLSADGTTSLDGMYQELCHVMPQFRYHHLSKCICTNCKDFTADDGYCWGTLSQMVVVEVADLLSSCLYYGQIHKFPGSSQLYLLGLL
jgi:hypothetical protein